MREKEIHMNELKNEVEKLRVVKSSVKIAESKVNEQEELIAQLREELMREKGEKEAAVSMKEKVVRESEEVCSQFVNIVNSLKCCDSLTVRKSILDTKVTSLITV